MAAAAATALRLALFACLGAAFVAAHSANTSVDHNSLTLADVLERLELQYSWSHEGVADAENVRRHDDMQRTCERLRQLDNRTANGTDGCRAYFDNVSCWLRAAAGTVATQRCPRYLIASPPDESVSMLCGADGQWRNNLTDDEFVAMYSGCLRGAPPVLSHAPSLLDKMIELSRLTSTIGYSISMVALSAAIYIFLRFRKLRCRRNYIHLNLFLSFFLRALSSVLQYFLKWQPAPFQHNVTSTFTLVNWECKTFMFLWNYFLMANYCWILVEGLYLYRIIYLAVFKETRIRGYVLFGWGAPILPILVWCAARIKFDNLGCWIKYRNLKLLWILRVPLLLAVTLNFFLFGKIVCDLYMKLKKEQNMDDSERHKKLAKSTLVLILLLGIHYVVSNAVMFATGGFDYERRTTTSITVFCVEMVFSSILGTLVAFVSCFYNVEVRAVICKEWKRWAHERRVGTTTSGVGRHAPPARRRPSLGADARARRHTQSCTDCQIRLQLLTAMGGARGSGDGGTTECTTQCSTVANSAQNSLGRSTGSNLRRSLVAPPRLRNCLSDCHEESSPLGSDANGNDVRSSDDSDVFETALADLPI